MLIVLITAPLAAEATTAEVAALAAVPTAAAVAALAPAAPAAPAADEPILATNPLAAPAVKYATMMAMMIAAPPPRPEWLYLKRIIRGQTTIYRELIVVCPLLFLNPTGKIFVFLNYSNRIVNCC
ncbi:hypothetical protein [Stutzerimonas stutzeri]|uniref:hypothetical protein n=1 Tax=Stutzerimonas stutzeri TaxID=316 RepID=UPI001FAECEC4|nr:hypothetical protein [Stutzerimonas stutzeri]